MLTARPGGGQRLVAPLVARPEEERGNGAPNLRGMALRLPALTPVEIQLVESWVAQGHPR